MNTDFYTNSTQRRKDVKAQGIPKSKIGSTVKLSESVSSVRNPTVTSCSLPHSCRHQPAKRCSQIEYPRDLSGQCENQPAHEHLPSAFELRCHLTSTCNLPLRGQKPKAESALSLDSQESKARR